MKACTVRLLIVGQYQLDNVTRANCPPRLRLIQDLHGVDPDSSPMPYTSTITSAVVVRNGPSRTSGGVATLHLDVGKQYPIDSEAHNDPVWDYRRARYDDVWVHFTDIEGYGGYATRTVLDKLPGG